MAIIAIFAAALAGWAFGALYYGLLGRAWQDAAGFSARERQRIDAGQHWDPTNFLLAFAAQLVMAAVLSGAMMHFSTPSLVKGATIGITIWLGFVATTMIVNNAYAMRSLRITAIDAFQWLGALTLMGGILGAMG